MNTTAQALTHWQALADTKANFAQAIQSFDPQQAREAAHESLEARNVSRALQMEIDTGKPHCPCTNPPHPRA